MGQLVCLNVCVCACAFLSVNCVHVCWLCAIDLDGCMLFCVFILKVFNMMHWQCNRLCWGLCMELIVWTLVVCLSL